MKTTISSGHGKYVPGASGFLNEVEEARRVTDRVAKYLEQLDCLAAKFHENVAKNKTDNLNNIWKFHNTTKRNLDFSVHFNAHAKTTEDMGCRVTIDVTPCHYTKTVKYYRILITKPKP